MKNHKLANVIAPDFKEFTALELAILLRELIIEVSRRTKASDKMINDFNQRTYDFTHEIELSEGLSRKEKADYYEVMEEHYKHRRMTKNENIITDEIFSELDWNTTAMLQKLTPELKRKIGYFKAVSGERVIKKSVWDEFYNSVYSRYL